MKDGGQAFPIYIPSEGRSIKGMTLRDYFAARIAPVILSSDCDDKSSEPISAWRVARIAEMSYQMADALLAKRQAD